MFKSTNFAAMAAAIAEMSRAQLNYRDQHAGGIGTIIDQKRSNRGWCWSGRIRPSRYNGATLREIRATGQLRECERRARRLAA